MNILVPILFIANILLLTVNPAFSSTDGLSISSIASPIPVKTKTKQLLVYELHIVNTGKKLRRVNRIEVRDDHNKLLASYSGAHLANDSLIYQDKKIISSRTIALERNMGVVIYMWIALDKNASAPSMLNHTIWSVSTNQDKSLAFIEKLSLAVPVKPELLPILEPPLKGNHWVAVSAIDNNSNHRRTISDINGKFYLDQRFAVDWEQISPDGRESHGNMHENKNWNSFGHEVLAVADGTIVNMRDNLKENTPPEPPSPKPSRKDIPGNFVVLKIQQHNKFYYVFYGHLKTGSILVHNGDKVTKGQVLGLVGNTGNSGGPHLHFHVMDGKIPLQSNGLPFVFRTLALEGLAGEVDPDYGLFLPTFYEKIKIFPNTIPEANDIVAFEREQIS